MDDNNTSEIEYWQRVACKLAWILSEALPEREREFDRFAGAIAHWQVAITDAGWDGVVSSGPMRALLPREVDALMSLPKTVRHADVRR